MTTDLWRQTDGRATIHVSGSRRTVEALALEVRRLAAVYGIELRVVRIHSKDTENSTQEASREGGDGTG